MFEGWEGPYRKLETNPWEEWFAWRPVKVRGTRIWLKKIYRRKHDAYVDNGRFTRHEYGTIFDVLKGI